MELVAKTRSEFIETPGGHYLPGDGWVYFGLTDELFGYSIFGDALPQGIQSLVDLMDEFAAQLEREHRQPHGFIAHLGRMASVDHRAFEILAGFIGAHSQLLSEQVSEAAIVRPAAGVLAAVVEGFFPVVGVPFPVSLCTDSKEALTAIGHLDPEAPAELERILDLVSGEPAFLTFLRSYIRTHLQEPEIDDAAGQVAMSTRSLQRRLSESSTTFAAEVLSARIDRAAELLRTSKDPVTRIAYEVGFSSPQHLSRQFRAERGLTPSEYRSEHE